jgi:hypothetical protein
MARRAFEVAVAGASQPRNELASGQFEAVQSYGAGRFRLRSE